MLNRTKRIKQLKNIADYSTLGCAYIFCLNPMYCHFYSSHLSIPNIVMSLFDDVG